MALERFVPNCLKRQLVAEAFGRSPPPERFDGVVLFIDIVGSTGITEKYAALGAASAERLADILNRYFGGVMTLIHEHGGDTVRIDGDSVIALWRAERPEDDVTQLTIRAAAAAESIRGAYCNWQPEDGFQLRHRQALLSGSLETMLISDGGERRFLVLAGEPIKQLGDPLLRGEPGQIILSDSVARILSSFAVLERTSCGSLALLTLNQQQIHTALIVDQQPQEVPDSEIMDALFRAVLPRVVVACADSGRLDWLAEFRVLSAVYISLHGLEWTEVPMARRLESAVRTIQSVVRPLGVTISSVSAGDKGFVVLVGFGFPPYAQERTAGLALEAAARILRALASMDIVSSIGVATGLAFCGDVGSDRRREYVATGAVMVHATRLMQMAGDGALCDGATAQAAGNPAFLSTPEPLWVKGLANPLSAHRVQEPAVSLRHQARKTGTIVFGRPQETRILKELLRELSVTGVSHGHGAVAAIEAEPGGGKSHLLAWVADMAQTIGYHVVTAGTSAIEQGTAYYVFREILPQLLMSGDHPHCASTETLRKLLEELLHGNDLLSKVALLEDILPLDFADKGLVPDIVGPARLAGIEAVMAHLLERRATSTPIVILVDDMHWIDASSTSLLAHLIGRGLPVLAVVATRPPGADMALPARALLEAASPSIRLPRLRPEAISQLVAERLGVAEIPRQVGSFIYERSEGLPFFGEQLAFALRDIGMIAVKDGHCHVTAADLSKVTIPGTLRDLIMSRIDRLVPNDQITVKVASAIGRVFDTDMLRRIHPIPDLQGGLETVLAQLSIAGILSRIDSAEGETFGFRHVILQGVTYDLLTYSQRRPLHRKIAQCLEERHRGALDNHYAVLAEHWERAEEPGSAIEYRIGAAEVAARRYANEDALSHVDRVESLAERFRLDLPAPRVAKIAHLRADAHQELTRFQEANQSYRKVAALNGIPMPGARGAVIARLAGEVARQALRRIGVVRAISQGAEGERDRLAAHIYMRCGEYAYFSNDTLVLAYSTLAALNRAERAQSLPEIVNAYGGLALGLSAVGLDHWAHFYREQSIQLATTAGSQSSQGFAQLLACVQSFHTADWPGMTLHGRCGAEIWQRLGDRYRHQCCVVLQAYCLIATGRYRGAEEILLEFGEHADDIESAQVRAWALAARAYLDLMLARPPQAALARLNRASAGGSLHMAERLLCDGIRAAAYLQAMDLRGALTAAESGLDSMLHSSPAMAGALLLAVPCIAETLMVVAEHATTVGRVRESLLAKATLACNAARKFAARNRICKPRTALLLGRLAASKGRVSRAEVCCHTALLESRRLGLPLEHAISNLALGVVSAAVTDRRAHGRRARELFEELGADSSLWSLVWSYGRPAYNTELEPTGS